MRLNDNRSVVWYMKHMSPWSNRNVWRRSFSGPEALIKIFMGQKEKVCDFAQRNPRGREALKNIEMVLHFVATEEVNRVGNIVLNSHCGEETVMQRKEVAVSNF